MQLDSPHAVHVEPQPYSASVTQVESNRLLPWLMLASLLSGAGVLGSVGAILMAHYSYEETRQLQIQVMDHNALLIREGLAQPTDEVYGPAGNIEYKAHPRAK